MKSPSRAGTSRAPLLTRYHNTVLDCRQTNLLPVLGWGVLGALLVSCGSWGAGAKLTRGSWLIPLHLDWLHFGHGLLASQAVFWIGVALLVGAWTALGAALLHPHPESHVTADVVALLAVAWMLPFLIAAPMLSRDVFSYLAQGAIQLHGYSAYEVGPYVLNEPPHTHPYYLEVSGDWRNTTTPYGPLHLGLMQLIVAITGTNVHAGVFLIKLLCMGSMVLIMWSAANIAHSLNSSPTGAVWLAGANPLMLLHLVGGMHNEAIMVAAMVCGLALTLRQHPLWGIALITLGAAVKATAAIALPFAIWMWVAQLRDKGKTLSRTTATRTTATEDASPLESKAKIVGYFFLTASIGAVLSLLVFGVLSVVTGTGLSFIAALSGSGKVINWLTIPTALAHLVALTGRNVGGPAFTLSLEAARSLFAPIMGILLIIVWAHFRRTPLQAMRGIAVAFVVICLCNSLAFPWYYSWILAFVGALSLREQSVRLIAAACAWGSFIVGPNGIITLYNVVWVTIGIIVAVVVYRRLGTPRPEHSPTPASLTGQEEETPVAATMPLLVRGASPLGQGAHGEPQ